MQPEAVRRREQRANASGSPTCSVRIFEEKFFHQSALVRTELLEQIPKRLLFDMRYSTGDGKMSRTDAVARVSYLSHSVRGFTTLFVAMN